MLVASGMYDLTCMREQACCNSVDICCSAKTCAYLDVLLCKMS